MKVKSYRALVVGILFCTVCIPDAVFAQGAILLNIANAAYSTPCTVSQFQAVGVGGLTGTESISQCSPDNNTAVTSPMTFTNVGQTIFFTGGTVTALTRNTGPGSSPAGALLDSYVSATTTVSMSVSNLNLTPNTTYTLYLIGTIPASGTNEDGLFTPLNNNPDIVFAGTTPGHGMLRVQFTTSASYVNTDTLNFTWAPSELFGDGVFQGLAIVPGVAAGPVLLNISDSTYPTPCTLAQYQSMGVSRLAGNETISQSAPAYNSVVTSPMTFTNGGQIIYFNGGTVGAWAKNAGPGNTPSGGLLDSYLYSSSPVTLSVSNLNLAPNTTYTLTLIGTVPASGTAEDGLFTPLNTNPHIVFASASSGHGVLTVQFTTSLSVTNTDTLNFIWDRYSPSGHGVFDGLAIVPGAAPGPGDHSSTIEMPLYGDYGAHDPSRLIKQGNTYTIFITSQGIVSKSSTDLRNWNSSGTVFPNGPPAWTSNAVPGFTGFFWAPDAVFQNGTYYLYYACSTFGSQVSAIGLATATNIFGPWTDQGPVIQSTNGSPYNTIDPCPLLNTDGTMWLTFGSYWNGIYLVQLNPATGKRISSTSPTTQLANGGIEGSFLYQHGGYYYLFVNWDACCQGINSTYNIRVGRSTSVTGPYLDRGGVNMAASGGSMFLESTARYIGPGQAGILEDNGATWFTHHYYDGNDNGVPFLGLASMSWSADGWPVLTNDWSAFYPFNNDAHENLGLYNGTLQSKASITNDPLRGSVLGLDGVANYVSLPISVGNCSTIAAWVKWKGGPAWQRIFDFGTGTGAYLFLTPSSGAGNLRFAITTSGPGGEQQINAPAALPTNSWVHVAVTLDGSTGTLYVDGLPVATTNSLTIRPWQTLARNLYIGKSQFTNDPMFSGEIDSFRIFGRALSGAEIMELAQAQADLAHRYSFAGNARDSIGMAHGTPMGSATLNAGGLTLTGTPGGYVNLPGGLVSGSSSVTLECWATLGANGNGARILDCGNPNLDLSYSPHTATGGQALSLATATRTVNLDAPGALDNQSVHVVCIVDPTNNYCAIYTNAVLQCALTNTLPALSGVSGAWSFIGRSLYNGDAWLNGTIRELRLYDGRLTPNEITADYLAGPGTLALPISVVGSNSSPGLTLSWPSYGIGFAPESSPALDTAATWTPLAPAPALVNDSWRVTLPTTNSAQFFRLRR